jgi:hypothetical protein
MVNTLEQTAQETNVSFSAKDNASCGCCGKQIVGPAYKAPKDSVAYHSQSERNYFVENVLNDF